MVKTKWTTISLPSEMLNELDEFAKTNEGKKYGLTSKSQIIALLVRKFLDKGIDLLSESNNLQNNNIEKLEKKMSIVQEKLEKYEDLFFEKDLFRILSKNPSSETQALHGKDGRKLIMKIDSPDKPQKMIVYHTTDKDKVLKDNHIEGLVKVSIFRKKIKCSLHKKDDSCIHIKYALENDEGFARTAYIQNVQNPILKKIIP
jgi:hypothetical protein